MATQKETKEKIKDVQEVNILKDVYRKPLRCTAKVQKDGNIKVTRDKKVLEVVTKEEFAERYSLKNDYAIASEEKVLQGIIDTIHNSSKILKDQSKGTFVPKMQITQVNKKGAAQIFIYLTRDGKDKELIYTDGVRVARPSAPEANTDAMSHLVGRLVLQMWHTVIQAFVNYKNRQQLEAQAKKQVEEENKLKKV